MEIGNRGLWGWSGLGCRVEWSNCSDKGLMLSPLWCLSGGICWDFTVAFHSITFCSPLAVRAGCRGCKMSLRDVVFTKVFCAIFKHQRVNHILHEIFLPSVGCKTDNINIQVRFPPARPTSIQADRLPLIYYVAKPFSCMSWMKASVSMLWG